MLMDILSVPGEEEKVVAMINICLHDQYNELWTFSGERYLMTWRKDKPAWVYHNKMLQNCFDFLFYRGRRGRDRVVVGFITTYAISVYHH